MRFNMFKKRDYSLVKSIERIDMTLSGSSRNIRYQLNLLNDRPRIIEVKYICDVEHFPDMYAYHTALLIYRICSISALRQKFVYL